LCNQNPCCEPQLGKRNLYRPTGGEAVGDEISARLWVLSLSDEDHSLLDIAERSGLPFAVVRAAAKLLSENGLLSNLPDNDATGPNFPDTHDDQ
jgi:aminopeptidase-like protein